MSSLAERFPALTEAAASERTLPVHESFAGLLPGLQRGATVTCEGPAAVSLALALAVAPSQQGAWVGVAGMPELSVRAAVEMGLALERLVMVADAVAWVEVLAAMIDGFDVVMIGPDAGRVGASWRRLQARAQARGVVLLAVGVPALSGDLRMSTIAHHWVGLGEGHGVATGRHVVVELSGRRTPRPRQATMWLPDVHGRVSVLGGAELRHQVLSGGDGCMAWRFPGTEATGDAFDHRVPVGVVEESDRLPA
jgi:hypothetical protein